MPRIPLLGKGAARSRVEVTQTLTHCRFAAVPLGKGDNKSHFRQALCPPYQGGQPRSGRGSGFESLLPRAPRDRSGKALLGEFGIGNKGLTVMKSAENGVSGSIPRGGSVNFH